MTIQGGGGHDTLDLSQIPRPLVGHDRGDRRPDRRLGHPRVSGAGDDLHPGLRTRHRPVRDDVNGSKYNDSFTANADALSGLPALNITGGGGPTP